MYQHLRADSAHGQEDKEVHQELEVENNELKNAINSHQHIADEEFLRALQNEIEDLKRQVKLLKAQGRTLRKECNKPPDPELEDNGMVDEVVQHRDLEDTPV